MATSSSSPTGSAAASAAAIKYGAPTAVKESVIRKMTRLARLHGAVNLSQGFPNEPPPPEVRAALARGALAGDSSDVLDLSTLGFVGEFPGGGAAVTFAKGPDVHQYSDPAGRPDLRASIAEHYCNIHGYATVDSASCVTVTLGATEAVASALRTLGRPGDRVAIFEPFHELYPSQCALFYLEPVYVTLREDASSSSWTFVDSELEEALSQSRIMILNTPHNPTGKVFSEAELGTIVGLCEKYDVYIVTDEIYEHMTYGGRAHSVIPKVFPRAADRTLVCNSMGKSASATGWRLGWCITPLHLSSAYRGVHDQLVIMAPHPVQYAAMAYLSLPERYFREILPAQYVDRLSLLATALRDAGFQVSDPEGAYYLFAKYRTVRGMGDMGPMDAASYLMETVGVACVPGDNFYGSARALAEEGREYLRFAACRSEDDVRRACALLKNLGMR